jgi:thioredoxin-related protein
MHKVIAFLLLSLTTSADSLAQRSLKRVPVTAMTVREADSASRSDGRPLFVYLYLRSCPACRSFESATLSDTSVRKMLAEGFHVALLDAGSRASVEWRGGRFGWNPESAMNDVVARLGKGGKAFPMTVIVSSDGILHQAIPGDIGRDEMLCLLSYVSESRWRSQSYDAFRKEWLKHLGVSRQ